MNDAPSIDTQDTLTMPNPEDFIMAAAQRLKLKPDTVRYYDEFVGRLGADKLAACREANMWESLFDDFASTVFDVEITDEALRGISNGGDLTCMEPWNSDPVRLYIFAELEFREQVRNRLRCRASKHYGGFTEEEADWFLDLAETINAPHLGTHPLPSAYT